MTIVPRRAVGGLATGLAAIGIMLAGVSPAGAAIDAHSRHAPPARDIRHERQIKKAGQRRTAGRRPRRAGAHAAPWVISVPAIGLTTDLTALGAPAATGGILSLPVPPLAKAATEAGWYEFTAVPGEAGNAVVVGHVDTYVGAAVFYDLYRLTRGDRVYVDESGRRQRFVVTSVRELPKPDFPVNQVFGATNKRMLWLITCGGGFDDATRHYLDNIVVSATWSP